MKKKLIYFVLAILCFIGFNDNVFANTIKSSDVPNSSYVIGTHMFTRETNDDTGYKGQLTTKFIMLAADTINSTNIDDMMIYYKTARGEWIDGISGESVEMPNDIEITNKNASMYLGKPILTSTFMGYESGYYNYEIGFFGDYCEFDESNNQFNCPNDYTLESTFINVLVYESRSIFLIFLFCNI